MEKLDSIYGAVVSVLEEKPNTRSSDKLLTLEIYKMMGVNVYYPFIDILQADIPSIETIGRCRRKAQQKRPELAAAEKVEEFRADREEEFKGFFTENGVY